MSNRNKPKNPTIFRRSAKSDGNANRLSESFGLARQRLRQQLGVARGRAAQNTSRFRAISPTVIRAGKPGKSRGEPAVPNVALSLHAPVKPVELPPDRQTQAIPDLQTFQEQKTQTGRLYPPEDLNALGFASPDFLPPRTSDFLSQRTQRNIEGDTQEYIENAPRSDTSQATTPRVAASAAVKKAAAQVQIEPDYHTSFLEGFEGMAWPEATSKTSQPVKAIGGRRKKRRRLRFIGAPRRNSQFVASILGTVLVALFVVGVLLYLRNYLDRAPDSAFSVVFGNLGEGTALAHTPIAKDLSHKLSTNYQRFSGIPQADLRFDDNVVANGGQAGTSMGKVNSDVAVWGEYEPTTKLLVLQLQLHPNGPFDQSTRHFITERLFELNAMPFIMAQPDDWNKADQFDQLMQAFYHYFGGEYQGAVVQFANLLKDPNLNPANEMYLRFWRGNALFAVNNYPAALLDYQRADILLRQNLNYPALEPNPLTLNYIFNNLAVVEAAAGNTAQAESDYGKARDLDESQAQPWLNLARLQQVKLTQESDPAKRAALQKSIEVNLNAAINQSQAQPLASAYLYRSQLYYQQTRFDEAEKDALKARQFNPDLPMTYNQLGWIYLDSFLHNGDQNKLTAAYDEFQSGFDLAKKLHDQYRTQWDTLLHTPDSEAQASVAEKQANDFQSQTETLNYGLARAMLERGRLQGTDEGNPWDRLTRFVQGKKLWLELARDRFLEIIGNNPNYADAHFYLGQTYFLLGQSNWKEESNTAKKLNPKNYEYYKTLADYYLSQHDTDAAMAEYKQYVAQDNHNYAPYLALADLYYRQGQYALAGGQATTAATLAPDNFQTRLVAGKTFNQLKEYPTAITHLQQAIALDANAPEAHYELGLALSHAGRTDNAIDELGVAAEYASKQTGSYKADPTLAANAHYYRGLALQQRGRLDEALSDFKLATANNKVQNADAWLHLGDLESQRNLNSEAETAYTAAIKIKDAPPLVTALAAFKLGQLQQSKGQFKEAEANFDQALTLQPGMREAQLRKGEAQQQQGKTDAAIATLNGYLSGSSNVAEAWRFLGDAQRDKGDYGAAITAYQKALATQNNYPEALLGLSQAYRGQKNYAEGLNRVNQAIKFKPDYAEAYLTRGLILRQQNQDDAAFQSFADTIKYDPNNEAAYINMGDLYQLRSKQDPGQLQEAVKAFTQAVKLNPKDSYPHYQLGLIYSGKNEPDQAITEMKQATTLRQDWPEAWFALGKFYEQKGRANEAMDALNNALKYKASFGAAHDEAATHYELGNVWQTKGSTKDAREEYKTAITVAQSHKEDLPEAWYQLGSIYESSGDVAQANDAYTHARDTAKDAELKRNAQEGLRRVGGQ